MHDAGRPRDPVRHNGTEITSSGPERRKSRSKRKSSRESKKLQRDPEKRRTYSFSPGRDDSIRVPRDAKRPPVPPLPDHMKGKAMVADRARSNSKTAGKRPVRASTEPPESTQDWHRMPTLHKRSAQDLNHRKSSKRRKDENEREAEIKAMAAYMPLRPSAGDNTSGRPMKRESKSMRGGLNRNLQNPSSDISLPTAESLYSSSDESAPQTAYKVSAFDALAPRPTIRYAENPRYVPGASGYGLDREESRKRRISERMLIPEASLNSHKRIDDLADDFDARDLRELMERDQKRREKKKETDRTKMERKLARRQEKQRAEEAEAARNGTPSPVNKERGVLGRDVVGLGIGTGTSAVVTSNRRKDSAALQSGREQRPSEAFHQDSTASATRPFPHHTASLATDELTPGSERSEPVIEVARVGTVGKANVSPPSSPKGHAREASSISQRLELSKNNTPTPDKENVPPPRRASEPPKRSSESPIRAPQSWTSFFKRSSKNKRGSIPSPFSNTSRDSMRESTRESAQNGQPTQHFGYTPVRKASNVPKRTMSRFREDLPELPLSPPDSRVQSPEADVVPPIRTDYPDKRGHRPSADDPRVRYDTPTSGYRSLETGRLRDETPTSAHRSMDAPSPDPVATQSLASIDSEGSWLSGRKGGSKRGSAQIPPYPLRDSATSLQKRYKEYSESAEELGIAEDEYFSRLTPGPDDQYRRHRISTGNPVPSSDEDDGGSLASPGAEPTKWGAVARQPTVVHREPRAKSREGFLNEFDDGSDSDAPGKAPSDLHGNRRSYSNKDSMDDDESGVHRAKSVDLGRAHARHISAGSARLLELKPRSSGDANRYSTGSMKIDG